MQDTKHTCHAFIVLASTDPFYVRKAEAGLVWLSKVATMPLLRLNLP